MTAAGVRPLDPGSFFASTRHSPGKQSRLGIDLSAGPCRQHQINGLLIPLQLAGSQLIEQRFVLHESTGVLQLNVPDPREKVGIQG